MHSGALELALVLLLAAVIAVPVFKKLGLGAVLGYLVAGVVLGPDGMGFVQDADRILGAAEIGVVMLLFVIGLELSPTRLKVMRRSVFGAGIAQVALSALVLGSLLLLDHFQWKAALIVGIALALSSTAVGLQLLSEHKGINSDYGRLGFAILLFQDLIAIPLLAAIPLLGGAKNETLQWGDVGVALGALAVVILCGRPVLRRLFNIIARTRSPEVFTAMALLVVLGTAWFMQEAGLSPSLGAFLAGVLLSDSEFRHELESQIEPFKGLLLGLFFIAVGMGIDLGPGGGRAGVDRHRRGGAAGGEVRAAIRHRQGRAPEHTACAAAGQRAVAGWRVRVRGVQRSAAREPAGQRQP
jgi:glutathione-regulated potassium-efflux system protein KefB